MSLVPGLTSAVDLFHKLQRDAERLNAEVTSDAFFNFVVTGYSIIDWIKNDPAIPASAKTRAELDTLYESPWLKVCGDLANASKHFTLTRRTPVTVEATSKSGFGMGRYDTASFGRGEESIEIKVRDTKGNESEWTALEFATAVNQAWLVFFARHGVST